MSPTCWFLMKRHQKPESKIQNKEISPFRSGFWVLNSGFFLALLSALPSLSFASKTGAAFLKAPIGARAAGMGQAFTAASNGIDALNWNVAGLAKPADFSDPALRNSLSFSHQTLLLDTQLNHLGFSFSVHQGPTFGINITRVTYASQERRSSTGRLLGGEVDSSDMSVGVAAADRFGSVLLGSQIKVIRQTLDGQELGQAVSLDLGLLSKTSIPRLSFGASIRNLGPRIKFDNQTFDLPLTLSVGTAYQMNGALNMTLDLHSRPNENQMAVSVGTELVPMKTVALRAGYLTKLADSFSNGDQRGGAETISNLIGFTAGMGFRLRQFSLDYSVTPFGELGNTQNFTLATWFGGASEAMLSAAAAPVVSSYKDPFIETLIVPTQNNRVVFTLPQTNEVWWYRLKP